MNNPVYLDYNASTPLDPRVWQAMEAAYQLPQVNSGSITHALGRQAHDAVEEARATIASSIGAEARDLIFTSGATEAINIAIRGIAQQYADKGKHIICSSIEHRAVLAVYDALEADGFEFTKLPVDHLGLVNIDELKNAIRPDTILCAVMHVNNEIGVIQDIQSIAQICNEHDVRLFVDAAQSWGKVSIDASICMFDAMAISAHKNYGPQGIGALYLRRKPKRLRLQPILFGGGQERELRPGTLPNALIAGMAKAAEIIDVDADQKHTATLREAAVECLNNEIPDHSINADSNSVVPGTLNIQLPGIDAQDLLCSCADVAMAMGSACTSSVPKPSHVLGAIGLDWQAAASSLRISFGRMTTQDELTQAIGALAAKIPQAASIAEGE